jgi:glycerophosphoryl diester phosphodiesterase
MKLTRRAVALSLAAVPAAGRAQPASRPLVIAHRGASGHRPEHTLMAYKLAIEQGADVIEPDLVVPKDRVLVCRHEPEISATTDVASLARFADRRVLLRVEEGREIFGWRAEDFTLAEIRTLRARERLPNLRPASARFDGREPPATLAEVLDLVASESRRLGRPVGIYPELKAPAELEAKGFDTTALLTEALTRAGLPRTSTPVYIQCFEDAPLRRLKGRTACKLVHLLQSAEQVTPQSLREIASYADGAGIEKSLITRAVVDEAHRLGLLVHAWTFRAENQFLPSDLRRGSDPAAYGDMAGEIRRHLAMGIDGLFSDFPDLARQALS